MKKLYRLLERAVQVKYQQLDKSFMVVPYEHFEGLGAYYITQQQLDELKEKYPSLRWSRVGGFGKRTGA